MKKRALKYDTAKLRWSLFPWRAASEVVSVMEFGAKKYSAHNWRGGFARSRLWSAALRHLVAYWTGETKDPETGLNHVAHAACCLLFLLEQEIDPTIPDEDDRQYTKEPDFDVEDDNA